MDKDIAICKAIMDAVVLRQMELGLSQEKMAETLGIERETYNRWTSSGSEAYPSKTIHIFRMLRFLGIKSIGDFEL